MSEVKISIGGRPITFQKSDSLVAIKRKAAPASEARIRGLTTAVADAATAGHLAGFELREIGPSSGAGGWGITTSDVTGVASVNGRTVELGYAPGAVTHDFGGTSSACPLVAGVCALMLSANPRLTAREVKELLRTTARRIGPPGDYDARGHSRFHGYGCVNALDAVRAAQGAQPAPRLRRVDGEQ